MCCDFVTNQSEKKSYITRTLIRRRIAIINLFASQCPNILQHAPFYNNTIDWTVLERVETRWGMRREQTLYCDLIVDLALECSYSPEKNYIYIYIYFIYIFYIHIYIYIIIYNFI